MYTESVHLDAWLLAVWLDACNFDEPLTAPGAPLRRGWGGDVPADGSEQVMRGRGGVPAAGVTGPAVLPYPPGTGRDPGSP